MSLNDVMARLAQDKPKLQTNEQIKQTELQTESVAGVCTLRFNDQEFTHLMTALKRIARSLKDSPKIHGKDKNKRITAVNELIHKCKMQKACKNIEEIRLIETTKLLRDDIDECITLLMQSRLHKEKHAELMAFCKMESLFVASLQQLSAITDYLEAK